MCNYGATENQNYYKKVLETSQERVESRAAAIYYFYSPGPNSCPYFKCCLEVVW